MHTISLSQKANTHRIKTPRRQYPLRRSIHAAPVPLQVPHDFPPPDLREHARNLLHVRCSRGIMIRPRRRRRRRRGRRCGEEEVADCEGGEGGEEEEGGDGEGLLLLVWHLVRL